MLQRITDETYDAVIEQSELAVLEFDSKWCPTCQRLEGILIEIAQEMDNRILVAKIDIAESPLTAEKMGILGIPTIVFLSKGQPVYQHTFTAPVSKAELLEMAQTHLGTT